MSVNVTPGQSLQSRVDANPTETLFILKSGTHLRQQMPDPRAGITVQFEAGVLCNGEYAIPYFSRPGVQRNGVQLIGPATGPPAEIFNYLTPSSDGVIDGHNASCSNWLIQDLLLRDSGLLGATLGTGGMGCKPGPNSTARRVTSNNHDQYGFGSGGNNILYEDCNADGNGHANHNANRGGCKLVGDGLIVRATAANRSVWSNNNGPGIWFDTGTENYLIEGPTSRRNAKQGIYIEVSQRDHEPFGSFIGGVIRQVLTVGNGHIAKRLLMYDGGAVAGHSLNCEMDRCVSYGDYKGFGGHQQDRHEPDLTSPLMELKNLFVHECEVWVLASYLGSAAAGIAAGVAESGATAHDGYNPFAGSSNNRFQQNKYHVHTSFANPFRWSTGAITFAQWKGAGHDLAGTFDTFSGTPAEPPHPLSGSVPTEDPGGPVGTGVVTPAWSIGRSRSARSGGRAGR